MSTTKTVTALSRNVCRHVPVDWGRSELTQFLTLAEEQSYASFATLPKWIEVLEQIDHNLVVAAPTFFHEIDEPRRTAVKLYMRALGTFRAACRLASSGQLYETTVLIRSILESATYAWACGYSQQHRDAWEKRSEGNAERAAAKKLFKWVSLCELLSGVDKEAAIRIKDLYDQTIELGAHPNVEGVALSSEVKQIAEEKFEIRTIFLNGEEAVLLAILDLSRAMEFVYRLLDLTIHDRLRILGIDQRVDAERRLVVQLISQLEAQTKA